MLTKTEMYDPASNSWGVRAKMLTGREGAGAAVIGGVLHVLGGTGGSDTGALTTNESYIK
ncbi:MAG: hypothetical protein ACAI18_10210 [Gemmatimonadales bacterium]